MYKRIIWMIIVAFMTISCSKQPPAPGEKAFEAEDLYILYALRAEEVGSFGSAADMFAKLYEKSHKKEYLYRELQDRLVAKQFRYVEEKTARLLEDSFDAELLRFYVLSLVHQKRLQEAKEAAIKLVKHTKKSEDYLLVADIYVKLKKYNMAVKYLEGAYSKNYDEKILDKISIILYMNLNRKKDAVAQLETHSRMFGCSRRICARLLSFYSKQNDVDGMLSVYKRMYKRRPTEEILEKIIQLYVYKKDYTSLRAFLEKNKIENEILLQLYVNEKKYAKASALAYKLYEKTQNVDLYGQGVVYEYESLRKPTKKRLLAIVRKLKKVIRMRPNGLYLNYLGYLLIDHNLDVKQGIAYVKKALRYNPNSAYYLDSLAWGYYKLGKCKKADKLFVRIKKLEGGDDPEVVKHHKQVKKCLRKYKKKKKSKTIKKGKRNYGKK